MLPAVSSRHTHTQKNTNAFAFKSIVLFGLYLKLYYFNTIATFWEPCQRLTTNTVTILFYSTLSHYTFTRMIIWFDSTVRANRLGIPFLPIFESIYTHTHRHTKWLQKERKKKTLRNSSLIAIICHPLIRRTFFFTNSFFFSRLLFVFTLSVCSSVWICGNGVSFWLLLLLLLHFFFSFDNITANTVKPCASIKKIKLSRVIYSNVDVLRTSIGILIEIGLVGGVESLPTTANSCYSTSFSFVLCAMVFFLSPFFLFSKSHDSCVCVSDCEK